MHRILIVDDHPLYRQGLRQLIEGQSNLASCSEADSQQSAMRIAGETKPDLVILDLRSGANSVSQNEAGGTAIADSIV